LIGSTAAEQPALSTRDLTPEHQAMVEKVATEITKQFDEILNTNRKDSTTPKESSCCCGGNCNC
jgi:gamma-glutamyl phosphate reductase